MDSPGSYLKKKNELERELMENSQKPLQILPIADTISGSAARENPKAALEHYNTLASQIW